MKCSILHRCVNVMSQDKTMAFPGAEYFRALPGHVEMFITTHVTRKHAFYLCENKGEEQLHFFAT